MSVETWDKTGARNRRWQQLVKYAPPYSPSIDTSLPWWNTTAGHATVHANNSFITMDNKALYSPGWTFWAMPFGCMDVVDASGTAPGTLQATRNDSFGCEGFYINSEGYALNRDYMVPAYNMSDYYQIFPTWSDGANVAGYRRDKVSPVSFVPAARLAHYRTWTYGPPDFEFRAGDVRKRLVIVFNWDFSPRAQGITYDVDNNAVELQVTKLRAWRQSNRELCQTNLCACPATTINETSNAPASDYALNSSFEVEADSRGTGWGGLGGQGGGEGQRVGWRPIGLPAP